MLDDSEVKPSEVQFLEKLKEGKNSVVFKVSFRKMTCVMKVYHDRGSSEHDPPDRVVNLFVCESTAYNRLKSKGLCKRGVIPNFYGVIRNIQPAAWRPNLDMFLHDRLPPNAILIEYIPNLQSIALSNYSEQRLAKLRRILDDIHGMHPRNMMVVPASSEKQEDKVLWIDFDSAQTFPEDTSLSPRQKMWVEDEIELVDYFIENLAKDYEDGRLDRTWDYYYQYN